MDNEMEDFFSDLLDYLKRREMARVSGGLKPDFDRAGWTW